jgi:hypothetical protein
MRLHDATATIRPSTLANAERSPYQWALKTTTVRHPSFLLLFSLRSLVRLIGICKKQQSARASDLGELRGMQQYVNRDER